MKILIAAVLMLMANAASAATWAGKLDLTTLPALGAWQSLESPDQAVGFAKRFWYLDRDGQEMIRVGLFGGVSKAMFSDPPAPARPLGGATLAVPGSLLDWALGTSWGAMWLPRLKTGLLGAYDLTRISQLHARPTFFGLGIAYPLGAP